MLHHRLAKHDALRPLKFSTLFSKLLIQIFKQKIQGGCNQRAMDLPVQPLAADFSQLNFEKA
jgi:hypothetical protein